MKRGIKSSQKLTKGQVLKRKHIKLLRPCLSDEISADKLNKIIGKKINIDLDASTAIKRKMIY